MNSGRFSDEELRKLSETVSHYVPEFERLRDNVNAHLLKEERMEVLLRSVRSDVSCLHQTIKKHQPDLLAMEKVLPSLEKMVPHLEKMLPRLDELLERFSQAKGIFWFVLLLIGMVSGAAFAQAFGWFGKAVSYIRGLLP